MTTRPTDEQRVDWFLALATDCGVAITRGNAIALHRLHDAIFTAGVEAAQAGMTVEHGAAFPGNLQHPYVQGDAYLCRDLAEGSGRTYVTRRVTDWQATP